MQSSLPCCSGLPDTALVQHLLYHREEREVGVREERARGVLVHERALGIELDIRDLVGNLVEDLSRPPVDERDIGARHGTVPDVPDLVRVDLGDQADGGGILLVKVIPESPGKIDGGYLA